MRFATTALMVAAIFAGAEAKKDMRGAKKAFAGTVAGCAVNAKSDETAKALAMFFQEDGGVDGTMEPTKIGARFANLAEGSTYSLSIVGALDQCGTDGFVLTDSAVADEKARAKWSAPFDDVSITGESSVVGKFLQLSDGTDSHCCEIELAERKEPAKDSGRGGNKKPKNGVPDHRGGSKNDKKGGKGGKGGKSGGKSNGKKNGKKGGKKQGGGKSEYRDKKRKLFTHVFEPIQN